jgi:hypothetical protein
VFKSVWKYGQSEISLAIFEWKRMFGIKEGIMLGCKDMDV